MLQEHKQAIALMRYGAIAPLVAGLGEEFPTRQAYFKAMEQKGLACHCHYAEA